MWDKLSKRWGWAIIIAIISFISFGLSHDRKIEWLENIFLIILFIDVFIVLPLIIIINTFKKIKSILPNSKLSAIEQSDLMKYLTRNDHLKNEIIGSASKKTMEDKQAAIEREEDAQDSMDYYSQIREDDVAQYYAIKDAQLAKSLGMSHEELVDKRQKKLQKTRELQYSTYLKKLKASKLFKPEYIDNIAELIEEHGIKCELHTAGELLTAEDKKQLSIKYRGKLSKMYFEALNDPGSLRESFDKYKAIRISAQEEADDKIYKDERRKEVQEEYQYMIKEARAERKELIKDGYSYGYWKYIPYEPKEQFEGEEFDELDIEMEYGCKLEHHANFDGQRFDLKEGIFDLELGKDIFPGEVARCYCEIEDPVENFI